MKGIDKMWTGQGEQEYREQHKQFNDAIPDHYPADYTIEQRAAEHPAYSGAMANTRDAANYQRAHYMHGPQSKEEHARFAGRQAQQEEPGESYWALVALPE